MNMLNEEIRVIQHTIAHLNRAIPLSEDSGKQYRMKKQRDELQVILEEKLSQCEDYKG